MSEDDRTGSGKYSREALVKKYGGEAEYRAEMRRRASKGGKTGKSGFHTIPLEQRQANGRKGVEIREAKKNVKNTKSDRKE